MDKSPEISITEDSQENTPNYGFRFGLKPARRLKIAIEALCDPQFNPTGRGKIEVNGAGFRITARSPHKVLGHLCLNATGLDNFQCRTPIMGNKLVDLRKIFAKLVVDDQDTVTVLQIDGSNQITFMFGENPTQEFTVGLFRNNGQVLRFSNFSRFCETALPSRDMHRLVDELFLKGKPQLVSVSIKKDVVRVVLGTRKISTLTYNRASRDMNFEFTRGLVEPWQRHQGFFFWPYSGVLQKAAGLLPYYFVGFAHSPPNHVILRFSLQEHGNLFFLKEAVQLLTKNIRD